MASSDSLRFWKIRLYRSVFKRSKYKTKSFKRKYVIESHITDIVEEAFLNDRLFAYTKAGFEIVGEPMMVSAEYAETFQKNHPYVSSIV